MLFLASDLLGRTGVLPVLEPGVLAGSEGEPAGCRTRGRVSRRRSPVRSGRLKPRYLAVRCDVAPGERHEADRHRENQQGPYADSHRTL